MNDVRPALSLIESLASMIIVSVLIVVSLDLYGQNRQALASMNRQARAQLLALDLTTEILQTAYVEPSGLDILFGPELGEPDAINGSRNAFDDLDDYHNLNDSPPQRRDGTALEGHDAWRRKVEVKYVQPANLAGPSLLDQGVKRITVWVCWNAASCDATNATYQMVTVRTNTEFTEANRGTIAGIKEVLPLAIK